jgi:hypothetical protein
VRRQGRAEGAVMTWIQLEDLVVDGATIAGQGTLRTLVTAPLAAGEGWTDVSPADLCLASVPLAFFIRFAGLMVSEELYLDTDASERTVLRDAPRPDPHQCLELIDRGQSGARTGDGS